MLARAMKITGIDVELGGDTINALLSMISDSDDISGWASNHIAECYRAGLIIDMNDIYIRPRVLITRAEAAYLSRLLLKLSDLI